MSRESFFRFILFIAILQILGAFTTLYTGQNVYIVEDDVGINLRYYSAIGYFILLLLLWFLGVRFFYYLRANLILTAVVFYFFITIFWSDNLRESFRMWNSVFFQMVLGFSFLDRTNFHGLISRMLFVSYGFVILNWVFLIFFPELAKEQGYFGGAYEGAVKGFLSSKNVLGAVLVFCCLIQLFSGMYRYIRWNFYTLTLLVLSILLLFLSQSATSVFSFFLAGFIIFICSSSVLNFNVLSVRLAIMVTLVSTAVLFALIVPIVVDLLGRDLTFSGRTYLWNFSLEYAANKWLLGYGINSFWREMLYDDMLIFYGFWNVAQAHNGFIEALLSGGVVGLILVVGLYLYVLSKSFKLWVYYYPVIGGVSVFCLVISMILLLQNLTESSFPYSLRISTTFLAILSHLIYVYSKSLRSGDDGKV